MRRVLLLFLAFAAASWTAPALAESDPESLVEQALEANSSLQAMTHRTDALAERARVAGAWPDPMVAVEYSNAPVTSLSLSDHPMSGLQVKVQQALPTPGSSRVRREQGAHHAAAADHARAEAALQLAYTVRRTWWWLTRTRLLKAVTQDHLARTQELLEVARVRYETGAVGQHAVLRLEVLRDRLADELEGFDAHDRALVAALNTALSESEGTFPTPEKVEGVAPPEAGDWAGTIRAHRPVLAQYASQQAAAEQGAELARLQGIPDPSVWAGYRVRTVQTATDPGTDLVSVGVGVPLPTGSGRQASGTRAAALQEASAARVQQDATLEAAVGAMTAIEARWSRAWSRARTLEQTLIPGAVATLNTTRSDFAVGRAEFASLFEAEVALLDLERARIGATIETHLQRAEAWAVLGTEPGGSP